MGSRDLIVLEIPIEKTCFKYFRYCSRAPPKHRMSTGGVRGPPAVPETPQRDRQPDEGSPSSTETFLAQRKAAQNLRISQKFDSTEMNNTFQKEIDKLSGVAGRTAAHKRTMDDAEFAQAYDMREADPSKRLYRPNAKGKVVMTAVKHVLSGGTVNKTDGMVMRFPAEQVRAIASRIQNECPDLRDTDTTLQFSRKVALECAQPVDAMYTDWEYDSCIADRILDQRASMKQLTEKYGPSERTIRRGVNAVLSSLLGRRVERDSKLNDAEKQTAMVSAYQLGMDAVRGVLDELRANGVIKRPGAPSYFSAAEGSFLIGKAMTLADMATPVTGALVRAQLRQAAHTVGKQMGPLKHATTSTSRFGVPRFRHAPCGPSSRGILTRFSTRRGRNCPTEAGGRV